MVTQYQSFRQRRKPLRLHLISPGPTLCGNQPPCGDHDLKYQDLNDVLDLSDHCYLQPIDSVATKLSSGCSLSSPGQPLRFKLDCKTKVTSTELRDELDYPSRGPSGASFGSRASNGKQFKTLMASPAVVWKESRRRKPTLQNSVTVDAASWAVTTCPAAVTQLRQYQPHAHALIVCAVICLQSSTCKTFSVNGAQCQMWVFDFVPGYIEISTSNPVALYSREPVFTGVNLALGATFKAYQPYLNPLPFSVTDGVVGCAPTLDACLCNIEIQFVARYITFDFGSTISFSTMRLMTSVDGYQQYIMDVKVRVGNSGTLSDPIVYTISDPPPTEPLAWKTYPIVATGRYLTLWAMSSTSLCELVLLP